MELQQFYLVVAVFLEEFRTVENQLQTAAAAIPT